MEKPLLSIIVPIYNGEKYLHACLDSILNQSYENWELILVDDGSVDNSLAICYDYSNDPRVNVIHRNNEGQAKARNEGFAISRGEYVSFVDCDDWLESDMYESMLTKMLMYQSEIVICGYFKEYKSRTKEVSNDDSLVCLNAEEVLKGIMAGTIGSYLPFMLFKREIIIEPIAIIPFYEDLSTLFKWVSHARKIIVWHKAFYHYRQTKGSSLHSFNPEKEKCLFNAFKERYNYVVKYKLLPGWDSENRRLYIRSCLKLAKDVARTPQYTDQVSEMIRELRKEVRRFLPISLSEIGVKYYIRLRMLMADVYVFIYVLRLSSLLSKGTWERNDDLYI